MESDITEKESKMSLRYVKISSISLITNKCKFKLQRDRNSHL